MKNLKDILNNAILEKLKVDDIIIDKFPIDTTLEKIIEFLKEEGFKEVEYVGSISTLFNKTKSKCFTCYDGILKRIYFGDTSKKETCKDNPIFLINYYRGKFEYKVYYKDNSDEIIYIVKDDKKAFLEELNKRFGW